MSKSKKSKDDDSSLLWWHLPRSLAGMAMPYIHVDRRLQGGAPLAHFEDELTSLHSAGIRAVVSLLNLSGDRTIYEPAGFDFQCLPVPDGAPPTLSQTFMFLQFVEAQQRAGNAVAVHCEAGLGRTGTLLAAYLVNQGASPEQAITQVRKAQPSAIETNRQIRFIKEFARILKNPI